MFAAIRADSRCIWRAVCKAVTGIDASRASLEVAEQNLVANREQLKADVDWVAGDAFEILRDWSEGGENSTPSCSIRRRLRRRKRAVEGALRGYKELNLRALKMARPGGLLVTCSAAIMSAGRTWLAQ